MPAKEKEKGKRKREKKTRPHFSLVERREKRKGGGVERKKTLLFRRPGKRGEKEGEKKKKRGEKRVEARRECGHTAFDAPFPFLSSKGEGGGGKEKKGEKNRVKMAFLSTPDERGRGGGEEKK